MSWGRAVRVSDSPLPSESIQWFPTMSVAPNGRIDAVWNDTRNTGSGRLSEVFYSSSSDGGLTWTTNMAVTPVWDSWVGWPVQSKIGDYYHMISDNEGANLAFAATFNGEQDVYFLRLTPDCNDNGIPDAQDAAVPGVDACENLIPDECEADFDGDGLVDACDGDTDNDGVDNETDRCLFSRMGFPVAPDGGPHGDVEGDCDLDLGDWFGLRLIACMNRCGPSMPCAVPFCREQVDTDGDTDIDMVDVARLQNSFTGRR